MIYTDMALEEEEGWLYIKTTWAGRRLACRAVQAKELYEILQAYIEKKELEQLQVKD